MRCWLCVVAAAAAASVAQKSEPKLLYPIMIQGGPNNQYQQFLESMLLAKALRRKIVLAPFLSWAGGGDRSRVHAFEATFDVDAVKQFVDVVSTKDMGEASTTIVTAGPNSAWRGKRELRTICGMARIRGGWCEAASHAPHLSRRSTPAARQRCRQLEKPWGSYVRCLGEPFDDDRVLGAALWASMKGLFGRGALRAPRTLAAVRALRRAPSIPVWKSTSASGAPNNSSLSHFSGMMAWPRWLGREVRNRHHHAMEQVSRRWRGDRRGYSGRTRPKFDFRTAVNRPSRKANDTNRLEKPVLIVGTSANAC